MERAIDGTKATKEVMEYSRKLHEAGNVDAAGYVMWAASIVDEQPTIEADPVKHGEWSDPLEGNDRAFQCSLCGGLAFNHGLLTACPYKYCPHCGAKMDKE